MHLETHMCIWSYIFVLSCHLLNNKWKFVRYAIHLHLRTFERWRWCQWSFGFANSSSWMFWTCNMIFFFLLRMFWKRNLILESRTAHMRHHLGPWETCCVYFPSPSHLLFHNSPIFDLVYYKTCYVDGLNLTSRAITLCCFGSSNPTDSFVIQF